MFLHDGQIEPEVEAVGPVADARRLWFKVGGGVVALAAVLILGFWAVSMVSAVSAPAAPYVAYPSSTPQTSAPLSPQAEAVRVVDSYGTAMGRYRDMDVTTFEALPRDERLRYAQWKYDYSTTRGIYEELYGPGTKRAAYAHPDVAGSIDNTAQEIVDRDMYTMQIANLQFVEGEVKPYDPIDGQKLLSLAYWDVGDGVVTNDYANTKELLASQARVTPLADEWTALTMSDVIPYTDKEGNQVQSKIITQVDGNDNTCNIRYVFHEYDGYDGTRQGRWFVESISKSQS